MRSVISRSVLHVTPSVSSSMRLMTTSTFIANATRLQKELVKSDRKRELMQEGKSFFEKETMDDALTGGLTPQLATSLAAAAAAIRITPAKSPAYQHAISWLLLPDVVPTMDGLSIGRVVHSELVLADPRLFEVLYTYLWRIVELSPSEQLFA